MNGKRKERMTKANLSEAIMRYGVLNPEKIEVAREVKDLGDEIKDAFDELGITKYTTRSGYTAVVTPRKTRKLNVERLEALLGKKIPDSCYDEGVAQVLSVTPPPSHDSTPLAVA